MRRPEIARAITNCWISDVPSKIVWFFESAYITPGIWRCEQTDRAEPAQKQRSEAAPYGGRRGCWWSS